MCTILKKKLVSVQGKERFYGKRRKKRCRTSCIFVLIMREKEVDKEIGSNVS